MISGQQMIAARALLNWYQRDLAKRIGVSVPAVCSYENGLRVPINRMKLILSTFKSKGINFVNDGNQCGVILNRNGRRWR